MVRVSLEQHVFDAHFHEQRQRGHRIEADPRDVAAQPLRPGRRSEDAAPAAGRERLVCALVAAEGPAARKVGLEEVEQASEPVVRDRVVRLGARQAAVDINPLVPLRAAPAWSRAKTQGKARRAPGNSARRSAAHRPPRRAGSLSPCYRRRRTPNRTMPV